MNCVIIRVCSNQGERAIDDISLINFFCLPLYHSCLYSTVGRLGVGVEVFFIPSLVVGRYIFKPKLFYCYCFYYEIRIFTSISSLYFYRN